MADNGFEQLRETAEIRFPGRVARLEGGAFAIVQEDLDLPVTFAPIRGSPECEIVRAPVLVFGDLARPGAFAIAALAGNFFWTGANGTTLSAGTNGKLYMTEDASWPLRTRRSSCAARLKPPPRLTRQPQWRPTSQRARIL